MYSKERSAIAKVVMWGAIALMVGHSRGEAAPVQVSPECIKAATDAKVESASKVGAPAEDPPVVRLGDLIAVKVTKLAEFRTACQNAPIILYLNGYPIRTARPYPPGPAGELRFVLKVTDAKKATDGTDLSSTAADTQKSNEIWRPVLGAPPWPWRDRLVAVSIGVEGQPALGPAGASLPLVQLNLLRNWYFVGWGVIFIAMLAVFLLLVLRSNILRNGNPTVVTAGSKGTCSLSKCQGALWFFIIVAAYLFIGLVTGDYLDSINGTALILLGIGAGTVVGSAAVDWYKDQPDKRTVDTEAAAEKLKTIDQEIARIRADRATNDDASLALKKQMESPGTHDAAAEKKELERLADVKKHLEATRLDKEAERTVAQSNFDKLAGRSEGWWVDILSDANGVSFHRFQLAAFTVVLGAVFILGVYDDLAMPEFNTTLLGLLGLSAGTYLGLKVPEATLPKKAS